MTLRSTTRKREAGRERGDIRLVGETGETAVRQILGALLSERDEGLDVVAGRIGECLDCGYGGIGEQLYAGSPLAEAAWEASAAKTIASSALPALSAHHARPARARRSAQGSHVKEIERYCRADLVVGIKAGKNKFVPEYVIEVKRLRAGKGGISHDLNRLAIVRSKVPKLRTFLFLFSESKRPSDFVTEEGKAILKPNGHYKVARVCKATNSFKGHESAHYACLIEVIL